MTALRETPGVVPEKNRHRRPWKEGSKQTYVPLLDPHEQGQWFMGSFKVPARLAHSNVRHSNDDLAFQRLCEKQIERWRLWRQMRGWAMTTKPIITGPADIPKAHAAAEADEDLKLYYVRARFRRMYTDYMPLEDFLHVEELGKRYGVDIGADRLPWNPDTKGDTGWVDPMKHAEERRQRLGIKRDDYRFDPDPMQALGLMDVPGAKDILKKKKGRR